MLLRFLCRHKGIGFILARGEEAGQLMIFHRGGRICVTDNPCFHQYELEFLRPYGAPYELLDQLYRFGLGPRCGDLILFGALDKEGIACFDDQVGGHGSVGGEQSRPFLILPLGHPVLERERLKGYEFIYQDIFRAQVGDETPVKKGPPLRKAPRSINSQLLDSEFFLHD